MDKQKPLKKCMLCNKTIKRFAKWNDQKQRNVHRSCWLNFRDFGDRYADVLFCPEKTPKKVIVVKPTKIEDSDPEGKEGKNEV
tara:strand:+ start:4021 stop:4269 length:249 start_codon:yes stop_codon:yes gene_type:complete